MPAGRRGDGLPVIADVSAGPLALAAGEAGPGRDDGQPLGERAHRAFGVRAGQPQFPPLREDHPVAPGHVAGLGLRPFLDRAAPAAPMALASLFPQARMGLGMYRDLSVLVLGHVRDDKAGNPEKQGGLRVPLHAGDAGCACPAQPVASTAGGSFSYLTFREETRMAKEPLSCLPDPATCLLPAETCIPLELPGQCKGMIEGNFRTG